MEMVVRGSGSLGNCYILHGRSETLIIEAGVSFKEVFCKGLNFRPSEVAGVLVTHVHGDHSKYICEFAARGIPVYASEDVFTKMHCREAFRRVIFPNHGYNVGGFKVLTMPVHHVNNDGTPCPTLAFVITHPEMGRLLYATDCGDNGAGVNPRRAPGLTHIMMEANWDYDIVSDLIESAHAPMAKLRRLPDSHMEITTTLAKLKSNDLTNVRDITLIHLSKDDADPELFKRLAMRETGLPVYIAKRGLILDYTL